VISDLQVKRHVIAAGAAFTGGANDD